MAKNFLVIALKGEVHIEKNDQMVEVFNMLKARSVVVLGSESYIGVIDGEGNSFEFYGPKLISLDTISDRQYNWKKIIKENRLLSHIFKLPTTEYFFYSSTSFHPSFYYPHPFRRSFKINRSQKVCFRWIGVIFDKERFFDVLIKDVNTANDILHTTTNNTEFCIEPSDFSINHLIVLLSNKDARFHAVKSVEISEEASSDWDNGKIDSPIDNLMIGFFLEANGRYDIAEEFYQTAFNLGQGFNDYKLYYDKFLLRKQLYQK